MISKRTALAALAAIAASTPAHAALTISTAATQNIDCSGGICAPTASDAVLNVGDLETLLASGNVEVTTTGAGVQAKNLDVRGPLTWASTSTLTLDSYESITIEKPVSITGPGGITFATSDGGKGGILSFGPRGRVKLANLASQVVIDGAAYTLVSSVLSLANAIAADPGGNFALADDYDASGDGVYRHPIPTPFPGNFQGLGNSISYLRVKNHSKKFSAALFSEISGSVENLNLRHVKVTGKTQFWPVGGIAAFSSGLLYGVHVSGIITGAADGLVGGVVGENTGTVRNSSSAATIHGGEGAVCGGVIGYNTDTTGMIDQSFAVGPVGWSSGCQTAGALVGLNDNIISDSYATGGVIAGLYETEGGGLIGEDREYYAGQVGTSYSTGTISAEYLGGFIGYLDSDYGGTIVDCYWNTTTSGTNTGTGNDGNVSNVTGLTTKQLRSGLPAGFDPAIWAEDSNINNGFPYLIANPPRK